MTHICVGNLTIVGSDNGLSPGRRQAIILTNAGILSIGTLGTNFNEISIGVQTFSFKKMHFIMVSAKCRPFCLGLNMLNKTQRNVLIPCNADVSTLLKAVAVLQHHPIKLRYLFRYEPRDLCFLSSVCRPIWRVLRTRPSWHLGQP